MPGSTTASVWERLKRRKVVQRGIAYLAVAWGTLEVLDLFSDNFGWSAAVVQAATVALAAGFLIAVLLAWYHGDRGHQRAGPAEVALLSAIGIAGLVGTGWMAFRPTEQATADTTAGVATPELRDGWVAVLPFTSFADGPERGYFAAGITQELTTALNRVGGLRVISPGSTARFRERAELSLVQIARQLGVELLVDGAIRMAGDAVLVTAQLVRASTGEQVWADRYERELTPDAVFDIEIDIARRIADALQATHRIPAERPTESLEAYNAYLQGLHAFNRVDPTSLATAIEHYRRAIDLDPHFALAHAGLAEVWLAFAHFGMPPHRAFPEGIRHADRALELDPDLGDAHTVLADAKFHYEWDWEGAEREFILGIENDAAFSTAHWWYAGLLSALGRHDEAIEQVEVARELDPLAPLGYIFAGQVYAYAGRYVEAEVAVRRGLELNPGAHFGHATLAVTLRGQGRMEEALVAAREAVRLLPAPYLGLLGALLAETGRTEQARAELTRVQEMASRATESRYVPPYTIAPALVALGEHRRALDLLEQAAESRDAALIWVNVSPLFEGLRDEPRFRTLVERMGLDPARPAGSG